MYWTTWPGSSASNYWANKSGLSCTYLKGTNCTMSLWAFFPFVEYNPLSPSSLSMLVNSAFPIPTIIKDNGSSQLFTSKFIVSSMSWIYPSVNINNIWYTFEPYCILSRDMLIASRKIGAKYVGPESYTFWIALLYMFIKCS